MLVEAQITINASKAAIWAAITDIENASEIITGIEKIEIVEKPAAGLVGLRWRETRMLFGKPATPGVQQSLCGIGLIFNKWSEEYRNARGRRFADILTAPPRAEAAADKRDCRAAIKSPQIAEGIDQQYLRAVCGSRIFQAGCFDKQHTGVMQQCFDFGDSLQMARS